MAFFLDIHTHQGDRTLIEADKKLLCIGLHPWYSERQSVDLSGDFFAVGEIGLDFSTQIDRELQLSLFRKQLDFALKAEKPVIIHCVSAYNEVLATLRDIPLKRVVFHSFSGSEQLAKSIVKRGYFISFSPLSLQSPKSINALRSIPLEMVFFETDGKDIPIEQVYKTATEILGLDIEELKQIINSNWNRFLQGL